MKLFKKSLAVLLAIVMLFAVAIPAFAQGTDKTPVVVIPGVLNTPIISESGQEVLMPDLSNLSDAQYEQILNTLKYILKLQDNKDYAGATGQLIDLLKMILGGAACNPDGTSKYPTHVIKNYNNYNTESRANEAIGSAVSKYIGKENTYVFTYDWRGEIIDIVDNELAPFIEKIKKDTGSEQVKIACVSMGGAVTSAYLSRYGDRNDVKKVVFVSSASQGVEFVNSLLEKDITVVREAIGPYFKAMFDFPLPTVFSAFSGYMEQIVGSLLDSQLEQLWSNFLQPYCLNVPAVWELAEHNETIDQKLEEYKVNPVLKQKVQNYYVIQDNLNSVLDELQEKGVEVCFISNYNLVGVPLTSKAMQSNTDFLITTRQTSNGATVADLFTTLGDNYQQKVPGDKNYISEDNIIDASTCYSPNKTWFIKNLVHAIITEGDVHSNFIAWLTVNNDTTIESDEKYPQFLDYVKQKDEDGKEFRTLVPVEKVVIEDPAQDGNKQYISSAVTVYTYSQITALGWALIIALVALVVILIAKKASGRPPIEGVLTAAEIKALPKSERKAAKKQNKARIKEWKKEQKAAKKARKAELKAMPKAERKAAIKADKAARKAAKKQAKADAKEAKRQRKIEKKAAKAAKKAK